MEESENKTKIIFFLKKIRNGLTIDELSAKTKLNRMTVSTYLRELNAEGKLKIRSLGVVKLHFWDFSKEPKVKTRSQIQRENFDKEFSKELVHAVNETEAMEEDEEMRKKGWIK